MAGVASLCYAGSDAQICWGEYTKRDPAVGFNRICETARSEPRRPWSISRGERTRERADRRQSAQVMGRLRHRFAALVVAVLVISMTGCGIVGVSKRAPGELDPAIVVVMLATIVDLNEDAGSVTVKEDETFETWRIAVVESTWIRDHDGTLLALEDLSIGGRLEIRGTSRVSSLLTAHEMISLEEHPDKDFMIR